MRDGLKPQSVDRELNIIVAMFNQAENTSLLWNSGGRREFRGQKIYRRRRERVWAADEIEAILGELFVPKRDDEQVQSAMCPLST